MKQGRKKAGLKNPAPAASPSLIFNLRKGSARSKSVWFLLKKIEPGLGNESSQAHRIGNYKREIMAGTTDPVLIIATIGSPQRAAEMTA
jgi:hypothetical protein